LIINKVSCILDPNIALISLIINKSDSKFPLHDIISCMVYECIVDDIDCTTHSISFTSSSDNDLPEWISNWKSLWLELKTFSDPNCSISSFTVFRKSLAIFCNSMEFSIVLLVINFVIFLETIWWDFLIINIQDALNIEFIFPISSWACKTHFCRSISWTMNPDSTAA